METTDLLLVGAEVSVAFAGFAGIIATFQFRDDREIKRGDVVGLTMIVQISLGCALLTVIPIVLSIIGIDEGTLWAACSAFGASWGTYNMYVVNRNMRGAGRKTSQRILFGSFQGAFGLLVISLILNAVDIYFHREPGPYLVGLVLCFSLVSYMFARLLLHPLWRAVQSQEAANISGATPS